MKSGDSDIKTIELFLASSFEGLEKDRKELGAFVDDLNGRYKPNRLLRFLGCLHAYRPPYGHLHGFDRPLFSFKKE